MNKQELMRIVEVCWQVACEAKMEGVKGMYDPAFKSPHDVCGVRYVVFNTLLSSLVPKSPNIHQTAATMTVTEPKEDWQG